MLILETVPSGYKQHKAERNLLLKSTLGSRGQYPSVGLLQELLCVLNMDTAILIASASEVVRKQHNLSLSFALYNDTWSK